MTQYKILLLLPVLILSISCSPSGSDSMFGADSNSPVVERTIIDNRVKYIKNVKSTSDPLSTLQYKSELLLTICKRAEQGGQLDYLAQRLYEESRDPGFMELLMYVKRSMFIQGERYPSRRSEVYKLYQKLEEYPGMRDKLAI